MIKNEGGNLFRKILVLATALLLSSLIAVATSTAEPVVGANDCMSVVYTVDYNSELSTLGGDNAVMVGDRVVVRSTCGLFKVFIDESLYSGGSNEHTLHISEGVYSLRLEGESWNHSFLNMTFYPGSEIWIGEYPEGEELVTVSSKSMWWDEIMAHGVTALIIYLLSTTVIYQLAKWRVDRAIYPVV